MEKRLERDESNKMLAGVAAGLADYLDVEVAWIRVLFVCLVVFGFSGIFIYIILWIALPAKSYYPNTSQFEADYKAYQQKTSEINYQPSRKKEGSNTFRYVVGLALVFFGTCFLLNEFMELPDWISFEKLWPLIFVAIGLVILLGSQRKQKLAASEEERPADNNSADNTINSTEEPKL